LLALVTLGMHNGFQGNEVCGRSLHMWVIA